MEEKLNTCQRTSSRVSIKNWNNWKYFLPRLDPLYPSRRPHLLDQKVRRKGGEIGFVNVFHQNPITFYTSIFFIPTSCTHILLFFSIHIHWPIIHVIFSFGRIKIDIIVYGRKRKTCINILLSFSMHILFFAHMLTHNSCYFFFWKDNNWHHCLWKEKKNVYYF